MSGLNHPRGTSNTNDRGSAAARRARREWLVETYRADVDLLEVTRTFANPEDNEVFTVRFDRDAQHAAYANERLEYEEGHLGTTTRVVPACRCYRCSTLLTVDTVTVDRIIPGCKGGTYRRNNIRPACGRCNSITGTQVREAMKAAKAA